MTSLINSWYHIEEVEKIEQIEIVEKREKVENGGITLKEKDIKIPEETYIRLTKFKGTLTGKLGRNFSYGAAIDHLLENQKEIEK